MRPVYETQLPWEDFGVTFVGDPHTFKVPALTQQLADDLKDATERGDRLVIWGDISEWIVPSDSKRYTNAKHNRDVDDVVGHEIKRLADFYEPYVNNIEIMKLGNHETEFMKRHYVDPMRMLIDELNRRRDQSLPPIFYGGYTMWWLVKFLREARGKRAGSQSVKFWLHHGAGGSAPVTKGMIDRARIYDAITADVYVIGHKHTSVHAQTKHEYLDEFGNVRRQDRDFIIVPGYSGWVQDAPGKNGYTLNWGSEKFYNLESTGSVRMRLEPRRVGAPRDMIVYHTVERRSLS